ncbi:hypothetical protein BDZ91DRAFT_777294 [Kalaharituber pfeilii]|nr:hypothetical protein BDZ91DRAFT_777294 [Kalaharituber pfeilii]
MASSNSTWSEQEAVQKVLRRAEVSRIARVLQHRLALATYKTKHGLEKLDLDTIEPRVEEDLKRKRGSSRNSEPPGHYGEADLEWLRENGVRSSSLSEHGPSRNSSPRKRPRTSSSDPLVPPQHRRSPAWRNNYLHRSSPVYQPHNKYTTGLDFRSSPPQTPPRNPEPSHIRTTEEGDPLIYLSAYPSPTSLMSKTVPFTPSTPPSKSAVLPSSMMTTPGAPQTPQTGFNFSDFVNITPSPAQAAFPSGTIRTPSIHARKRLNFDNIVPSTGSPGMNLVGARMAAISVLEIGGELVK